MNINEVFENFGSLVKIKPYLKKHGYDTKNVYCLVSIDMFGICTLKSTEKFKKDCKILCDEIELDNKFFGVVI